MHDEDIRRGSLAPAHEDEIMERSLLTPKSCFSARHS